MEAVLVAGLTNIETTLRVDGFPVAYAPVRYPFFGVDATVSGVGYNVATALASLGNPVRFLSVIGRDLGAALVLEQLRADGLSSAFVVQEIERTARSVILYDADGRRMIHVDLKDLQERAYPESLFEAAARDVTLAVLCNINFARPMLAVMQARGAGTADRGSAESLYGARKYDVREGPGICRFACGSRSPSKHQRSFVIICRRGADMFNATLPVLSEKIEA